MPNTKVIKYNNIKVDLIMNPQYKLTTFSKNDSSLDGASHHVEANQIRKLTIVKSFEAHTTSVNLELTDVDHTQMAYVAEGKYLVRIQITADNTKVAAKRPPVINYFICEVMIPLGYSTVAGTYPGMNVEIKLKAVNRVRLEIENNFPFELGGKGGSVAVGHAATGGANPPYTFLTGALYEKYLETYFPFTTYNRRYPLFDLGGASSNSKHIVSTGPTQNGYKIEANTNMDTFDFFFKHYPVFLTPHGWFLDDMPTDKAQSHLYVKDFMVHTAWAANLDPVLSELLGGKPNTPSPNVSSEKEIMDQHSFSNIHSTDRSAYYNASKYLFRDYFPKIYAESIADNSRTLTQEWNALYAKTSRLAVSGSHLVVKYMDNPKYKQYLTFLSADELTELQKNEIIFMALHPELATYRFEDVYVGDVDIHKSIKLNQENLSEFETYGFDRVGTGYYVEHVYEQIVRDPKTNPDISQISDEYQLMSPTFRLTTEITMLTVDDRNINNFDFDALASKRTLTSIEYDPLNYFDLIDIDGCGQPTSSTDLGDIPFASPGSPGNTTIADSASTLIDTGFTYRLPKEALRLGGKLDCSDFTMYAVQNSGGDSGRKKRYPNGTWNQFAWLNDPGNGAQRISSTTEIQRGDIVFFGSNDSDHGHTGIAKSSGEYYHSTSVRQGGAAVGTFARRRPNYIYRLRPIGS